jgi:hypothetical protein
MNSKRREYTLGIWALTLGYFVFYVPYSGLTKAATSGLLPGFRHVPGAELLPAAAISNAIAVLLFISLMGWWKYGRKRTVAGRMIFYPRRQTLISGLSFATIIITTTLAYSFSGVSILFALVLMRAGVLIMSPLIDRVFHRRVRWFSWTGLALSLAALLLSFSSIHEYQLALATLLNLAAYLTGYALRLPCMTQIAKTGQKEIALNYFVEEQIVAMPALVLAPALLAIFGRGEIPLQLQHGFSHLSFSGGSTWAGVGIGLFYAGLGICLSFIYLDRRENTFCMPLFACSSLLSGLVASYILRWWLNGPPVSGAQIGAAMLIAAALLVMSPLHHLPLYLRQLKGAIQEHRLVVVDFSRPDEADPRAAPAPAYASFITVNFDALRQVLHKQANPRGAA